MRIDDDPVMRVSYRRWDRQLQKKKRNLGHFLFFFNFLSLFLPDFFLSVSFLRKRREQGQLASFDRLIFARCDFIKREETRSLRQGIVTRKSCYLNIKSWRLKKIRPINCLEICAKKMSQRFDDIAEIKTRPVYLVRCVCGILGWRKQKRK